MPIPEGYSIPITAPLYEGPTYKYIHTNTILCVFRTTKEVMEKVVPKPLVYNSDLYIYAWVNHLPRTTGFCHYREMFLTIPVEYPGKDGMVAGNYNAHLYLDNDSPIAAGREIYGYPKKLARVNFTEQEDVLTRSVERGGHEIFKVAISPRVSLPTDPIDPLVAQLALPFINYKLIPSVVEGAKPDVAQLTLMELTNFSCTKLDKGPATVEFNSSPADPLGLFKVEEVIGGWYFEGGYDLPYGSVLHDYLKED